MKKICFILPNLNAGGAEKVALNYLRQLDKKNYEVNLVVFNKTRDLKKLIPANVKIIDLQTKETKKSFFGLIKVLNDLRPEFIFSTHHRVHVLLQIVKPFVNKFKHLARIPSMPSLEIKFNYYGKFSRFIYSLAYRSASCVIAQTQEMKEDARKVFSIKKNIKVMSNPLDKHLINQSIVNISSPFNHSKIQAIASGRISNERAFDVLIHSIKYVVQKLPNFELKIIGRDQGELNNLNKLLKKLDLNKNISFLGHKQNPYIYYHNCDLFILSSRIEGFPNTILENYYLNTPIVSTRCVNIIEKLIVDGKNGYTCEVDNVFDLSKKIELCVKNIKRKNIRNPLYIGSKFTDLF